MAITRAIGALLFDDAYPRPDELSQNLRRLLLKCASTLKMSEVAERLKVDVKFSNLMSDVVGF